MKFSNEEDWNKFVETNSVDEYSNAVVTYAKRWAELMEELIDGGQPLEDIAQETSHIADTEGITGFMYGAAVSVLARTWVYGEKLRIWHNGKYDVPADAEGTVNPAIITIG